MEKAKAAVSEFMSKAGHHDTTVHERVAPSVQHTTVSPEEREERRVATDREIHQDHYHTSVQPVKDREVLPEQHHHNILPVENRTHDHRNIKETENHLKTGAAQFKDEHVRNPTHHASSTAPAVAGEHVHHHIHETIQPVIQKETIEPHVVHTTVPVHEVHHNTAQHHAASALPAVNMADFKREGGSLTGRGERTDHFAGEPRSIEHSLGNKIASAGSGSHHTSTTSGSGMPGSHDTTTRMSSIDGQSHGVNKSTGVGVTGLSNSTNMSSSTSGNKKASLMDKLNPKKDADGDGKKGFMD